MDSLNKFEKFKNDLNSLEHSLDSIVKELGWEKEFFLSKIADKTLHICPFDTSHEVNEKNLENHIRTRHLELESNNAIDNPLPSSSEFFYGGRIPSIQINKETQSTIIREAHAENPLLIMGCASQEIDTRDIPQSHDDIVVNFTRDEKLAIYKYAIDTTGHHPENEISIPVQSDSGNVKSKMTFAEILAYNRNLKRRRMKYRTTKEPPLSHTEEIRKLIGTQMDALEQYLGTGNVSQQSNGEIGQRKFNRNVVVKKVEKVVEHRSRNSYRDNDNANLDKSVSKARHSRENSQGRKRHEKEKKKKRCRERSSSSSNSSKRHSKKSKKSDKKKRKKRDRKRSNSKSKSRN